MTETKPQNTIIIKVLESQLNVKFEILKIICFKNSATYI